MSQHNDLAQRLEREFEIARKGFLEAQRPTPDIEAIAAQALEGQRHYEAAIQQRAAVENARRSIADFEVNQRMLADMRPRYSLHKFYKHPKHIITYKGRR